MFMMVIFREMSRLSSFAWTHHHGLPHSSDEGPPTLVPVRNDATHGDFDDRVRPKKSLWERGCPTRNFISVLGVQAILILS